MSGGSSQGLEKRYGYFRCPSCEEKWTDPYVWCTRGTDKVYNKHECKKCHTACEPYRTEPLNCSKCHKIVKNCQCHRVKTTEMSGRSTKGLEKRFGYFRCLTCKAEWRNANVWCVRGTDKVFNKQDCKKCHTGCTPYRTDPLKCPICLKIFKNCGCK